MLGLFQRLDRHISVESIKTLLLIALNENRSVNEYARMAGVGGGAMSRRIGDLGELDRNCEMPDRRWWNDGPIHWIEG